MYRTLRTMRTRCELRKLLILKFLMFILHRFFAKQVFMNIIPNPPRKTSLKIPRSTLVIFFPKACFLQIQRFLNNLGLTDVKMHGRRNNSCMSMPMWFLQDIKTHILFCTSVSKYSITRSFKTNWPSLFSQDTKTNDSKMSFFIGSLEDPKLFFMGCLSKSFVSLNPFSHKNIYMRFISLISICFQTRFENRQSWFPWIIFSWNCCLLPWQVSIKNHYYIESVFGGCVIPLEDRKTTPKQGGAKTFRSSTRTNEVIA